MALSLTPHFTNLLLMAGMVTIRKGSGFWSYLKATWGIDVVQEEARSCRDSAARRWWKRRCGL